MKIQIRWKSKSRIKVKNNIVHGSKIKIRNNGKNENRSTNKNKMKNKKLKAIKELLKGFWFIFIKGRHPAQFKHWYGEWWKPLYWD